ncbi:MAG: alpha/beta hydrolase [Dongiaceae bacterium]
MLLLSAALVACAGEALLVPLNWDGAGERIATTTDVSYGADARQRLDIYRPADARKAPVILFWYGGSWQHGAKDYYAFVGAALARQGFVAILPDYRLAPDHPFPTFVEDAASAVGWAHDHADELGGDPRRIYLSGHSAGGHSALMLALDPRYLRAVGMAPRDLAGVVSLAGPTGLEHLRGEGLKGVFPLDVPDESFSPIALAPRYAALAPPILLITGLDDDVIYAGSVARLADAIRAGDGQVVMKAYPDTGHLGLLLGFSDLFEAPSKVAADMARFAGL